MGFDRAQRLRGAGRLRPVRHWRTLDLLSMPTGETIYEVANRVATITLNRPDKLNAWTATMEKEVRASFDQAERDDNVGVIVLTGAGRGFCAGADMSLLSSVAAQGLPGGE